MEHDEITWTTAELDGMDWADATAADLSGFAVESAEIGAGPDGVLLMRGRYSGADRETGVAIYYDGDPPAGLRLQKAFTNRTKEGSV